MELRATRRNRTWVINALLDLAAKTARILRDDGSEEELPREMTANQVTSCGSPGRFRSRTVSSGHSSIDKSIRSGKPMPVEKTAATAYWSDDDGSGFGIEASRVGPRATLVQIGTGANAQRSRARCENYTDKVLAVRSSCQSSRSIGIVNRRTPHEPVGRYIRQGLRPARLILPIWPRLHGHLNSDIRANNGPNQGVRLVAA